ncbi:MAG: hypothetical protein O7C59_06910 [Rickettsia endosymbiont of Ixodes persulcatus]|nr:hypothetical protein [Rickettsia endosymbiont of Ixodes persulcatus]
MEQCAHGKKIVIDGKMTNVLNDVFDYILRLRDVRDIQLIANIFNHPRNQEYISLLDASHRMSLLEHLISKLLYTPTNDARDILFKLIDIRIFKNQHLLICKLVNYWMRMLEYFSVSDETKESKHGKFVEDFWNAVYRMEREEFSNPTILKDLYNWMFHDDDYFEFHNEFSYSKVKRQLKIKCRQFYVDLVNSLPCKHLDYQKMAKQEIATINRERNIYGLFRSAARGECLIEVKKIFDQGFGCIAAKDYHWAIGDAGYISFTAVRIIIMIFNQPWFENMGAFYASTYLDLLLNNSHIQYHGDLINIIINEVGRDKTKEIIDKLFRVIQPDPTSNRFTFLQTKF